MIAAVPANCIALVATHVPTRVVETMLVRMRWAVLLLLAALGAAESLPARAASLPNVLFILADDMGYGDPRCFNPDSKIPTPHIDRLAAQGMRFTDAHAPGSVCVPSRYGLLTGRYPFRNKR